MKVLFYEITWLTRWFLWGWEKSCATPTNRMSSWEIYVISEVALYNKIILSFMLSQSLIFHWRLIFLTCWWTWIKLRRNLSWILHNFHLTTACLPKPQQTESYVQIFFIIIIFWQFSSIFGWKTWLVIADQWPLFPSINGLTGTGSWQSVNLTYHNHLLTYAKTIVSSQQELNLF